jgi:flagellar hook-length control protein FliK
MTAFASIVLAAQPGLGAKSGVDGAATADGKGVDGAFEALMANLTAPASDSGSTMSEAEVAAATAEPMSAENLLTPDTGQMAAMAMPPVAPTLIAPTASDAAADETSAVAASSRPVSPPNGLAAEVGLETVDPEAAAQPAPTAADPAEASPPIPAAPPPAAAAPRSAGEAIVSLIGRVLDGARKPEAQAPVADAASAQAALEEIPVEAVIDNPVELAVEAALSPEAPLPVETAVVGTSPSPTPAPGRRNARADAARAETATLDPVASDLKSGDRPAAAPSAPAAATAGRSDLPIAPAVLADAGAEIEPATPDAAAAAPALQASAEAPVEAAPTRGSPETVARLAADIARKLEGKTTRFDVQLDPLGLGKVDVSIEINADGRLTAALSFDSSQTAAELRGRAGELRQALEAAGFDLAEGGLSFDMNNPGGSGGREARESLAAWSSRAFQTAQTGLEQADALVARSNWSRTPSGGVDIRI